MLKTNDGDMIPDLPHRRVRRVAKHWLKWHKHDDGFVYVPYQFSTSFKNGMFVVLFTKSLSAR